MSTFRVLQPGMFTTVQDLGRPGHCAIGVPQGGAIDPLARRIGNRIVGNHPSAAALEMTLTGGTFEFAAPARIALTGADANAHVLTAAGRAPVSIGAPISLKPGDQLHCGPITRGVRSYLGIQGGIIVPDVLGSRSTLPAAGFGGFQGRPLQPGDLIEYADVESPLPSSQHELAALAAQLAAEAADARTLRVVPGAHADRFDRASVASFYSTACTVTPRCDRAGIRLEGAPLTSPGEGRLTSEGMMPGAVQIPQSGQPIILAPDGPTTGGYPVIAAVITADLHTLGQLRPLTKLRFEPVTLAEARALFLRQQQRLHAALEPR